MQAVPSKKTELCKVADAKGEFVAWAYHDPHSPIALRILSLEKKTPDPAVYESRLQRAWDLRGSFIPKDTDCFRFLNGEGDYLPGLVCDVYDRVAVVQTDGRGPGEFWDRAWLTNWILRNTPCRYVVEKTRGEGFKILSEAKPADWLVTVKENGVRFKVDLENGQKTGFFLDQRDNRQYLRSLAGGRTVLNLFSYTGGFSLYAGVGEAKRVASVDIAEPALDLARAGWALNELPPEKHESVCADVFAYLAAGRENWDIVLVDPPSMAHSEEQKERAMKKYAEAFGLAAQRVNRGGHLCLSSCSSHISFNDFFEIIDQALSQARRRGQVLRVSGQGPDHPFPHACHELRYLKFVHLVLD